jgi:uncharacterized phiE125 gp8 family phage protein
MNMTTSGWQLRRISGPDVEPLTLEQARRHLKLDADLTAEDEDITDYIVAARELCEEYTKRTFVESTWLLTLDSFPDGYFDGNDRLTLPMGPVIAVVGVSYVNQQGTRVQIADYQSALDAVPGYILPPLNQCWPFARCGSGQVAIEYRAGYPGVGSPTNAANVPKRVTQTMRAIIAKWFEERAQVNVDDILQSGLFTMRVIT